jgi:replicative DNA helicase
MRDIREGDEVYHPSGRLTRVTAVSEIVHDRDCYRVTTTDGRSVVADRDRLWTVVDKRRSKRAGPR